MQPVPVSDEGCEMLPTGAARLHQALEAKIIRILGVVLELIA